MVINFIMAKSSLQLINSLIVYIIPFPKKDLMWLSINRHRKDSIKKVGGNGETKLIHDLGKGEGRFITVQVEV